MITLFRLTTEGEHKLVRVWPRLDRESVLESFEIAYECCLQDGSVYRLYYNGNVRGRRTVTYRDAILTSLN